MASITDQAATGCPDGGKCHHECVVRCWRVSYAGPLSAYGEDWTDADRARHDVRRNRDHRVTVGCTVAYDSAAGTWNGEVLEIYTTTALVRALDPDLGPEPYEVPLDGLRLVGDPEGMREDGCDDVDVTGRARPFHRHAVTGKAHAHPSGELAHTHETPEQIAQRKFGADPYHVQAPNPAELAEAGERAAAAARRFTDAAGLTTPDPELPDPVTVLVAALHQTLERAPAHWSSAAVLAGVRRGLAELVAGPWHLVTGQRQTGTVMHLAGGGQTPGERLIEIHEEWRP